MGQDSKIKFAATLHALGDTALTLEFGEGIDRGVNARVMAARRAIEAAAIDGVSETVPTFRALAVHFDPDQIAQAELLSALGELDIAQGEAAPPGKTWRVPVLYDGADLDEVAKAAGLSANEAAALHTSTPYHVYMLGFLPGFAYLGDLPERLRLPRLKEPRTRVPPGAVAIADQMTAIYPVESPGGWRLIGRTPLRLFDADTNPPSVFSPGDTVVFHAVDEAEFERLEAKR
jgi:inhibitor of KinA